MDNSKLLSTAEAAEFLGITTRALRKRKQKGQLVPSFVDDRGYDYYSMEQLEKVPRVVRNQDKVPNQVPRNYDEVPIGTEEQVPNQINDFDPRNLGTITEVPIGTEEPTLGTNQKVPNQVPNTNKKVPTHRNSPEKDKAAINEADKILEIDNTTYYAECQQHITHPACVKYLQGRGLPIDFCREHGVGFDIANYLVVIPHTKSFCTRRYIGDNPNRPRFSYQKGSHLDLFNVEALANNPIVAVTESAFDALTLMYLGIPTVGLGGTSNWQKFANSVKVQLNLPIVLLALDNDEAGQKTSNDIEEELSSVGIFSYDISKMLCGTFKDPNERLQRDFDGLNKSVEHIISEKYTEYLESLKENFDIIQEARIKKWEQIMSLFNLPNTDDDNAKRILKLYGSDIRFLFDLDRWLMFKSPVWSIAPNTKNSVLYPLARKLSDSMLEYAKNDEQIKQANMLQSRKRRSDAIEMIKGYDRIIINSKDLNNHPMLLNCANGVIDLETGRLMERDKSLLFTLCTGAKYHAGYHSQAIDTFLKQVIPDEATLEALLLYLGYCLTASTCEEKALFIHGGGGNGKGTLMKVFARMLGTFATPFKIDAVLTGSYLKDGEAPTPELAKLEWKRVAIAEEIPAGRKLDIAKFKLLTGGDPLPIRRLHAEATFIEDPTHKMIFSGNHLPEIDDTRDPGLKRRLMVIEFKQDFTGDRCNTHLKELLLQPEALCGLLSLLVAYCIKWQKYGLKVSNAMILDRREYLESNDTIGSFIEENCDRREDLSISRADFLKRIRLSGNVGNMTDNAIIAAARKVEGIYYKRARSGAYHLYGIGWKNGERQEYLDSITDM